MLVPFVIFILSIVLYIIAPLKYDYMFCTLCFALCLREFNKQVQNYEMFL